MDERELAFERIRGAKTIIPSISGYDGAHQKAMQIAAFMEIVEGKSLSQKSFYDLEREFREEPPKLGRRK